MFCSPPTAEGMTLHPPSEWVYLFSILVTVVADDAEPLLERPSSNQRSLPSLCYFRELPKNKSNAAPNRGARHIPAGWGKLRLISVRRRFLRVVCHIT